MAENKLEKLGLRIEFEGKTAKVYDKEDKLVGRFPFDTYDQPYKNIKTITPTDSKVASNFQGKGIATEVYKEAEKHFNAKIIPDDLQSYQGNTLHEKKGLGKEFGISSNELDSNLTKKERRQRHSRQRALSEMVQEIAEGKHGNDISTLSKFGSGRPRIPELSEKIRKKSPSRNLVSLLNDMVSNAWVQDLQKIDMDKLKKDLPTKLSRVKSVPLIGPVIGAGLATMAGDASAAIPVLNEADSLGPEKGSEDYEIENPQRNPAARRAALEKLSR